MPDPGSPGRHVNATPSRPEVSMRVWVNRGAEESGREEPVSRGGSGLGWWGRSGGRTEKGRTPDAGSPPPVRQSRLDSFTLSLGGQMCGPIRVAHFHAAHLTIAKMP